MLFFFAFLILLSFVVGAKINYYGISPHPFWIIIILIAAQYGIFEGIIAALVSTAILLLGPIPARNVLQDYFDYFFFLAKLPMLWIATATILGSIRMKHIAERDRLKDIATQSEEKQKQVAESYNALKNIKERLEFKLASEMQTALMEIKAFIELEEYGKEGIINGAKEITKALVAPENFSIFILESNRLERIAFEGSEVETKYSKIITSDTLLYKEIVDKKKVVSINTSDPKILNDEGVLAAPIIDVKKEKVYGMIKIELIPFLRLRTNTIESLKSIGELVGRAFTNYLDKKEKNENT